MKTNKYAIIDEIKVAATGDVGLVTAIKLVEDVVSYEITILKTIEVKEDETEFVNKVTVDVAPIVPISLGA
jgi:hypothetical protein